MNGGHHRLTHLTTALAGLLLILNAATTMADEIVMTTGETFSSTKVWEEDGKIRFNMHGLVVSVEKSEVAQIIRDREIPQSVRIPAHPQNQAPVAPEPPQHPEPASHARPATPPPADPLRPVQAPRPNNQDRMQKPSAVSGVGLEGITWHLQPSDLPGLIKIETDPTYGGIDQYYRENEIMSLGPATLDGKAYGFWRNRLYTITMWVEGSPAYRRLREAVFERFGKGRQNSDGLERYIWEDPGTDRMLEFDERLNTGLFWMRSRALDEKIKLMYGN